MLVSDRADAARRAEVSADQRPCPEYLRLEQTHKVELLDWSRLSRQGTHRSTRLSLNHVARAIPLLGDHDVVFSDGEHLGIPLALAMRALGVVRPHLVLGHHLTTRLKRPFFRFLRAHEAIDRILVHSNEQLEEAQRCGIPPSKLALVPYYADTAFWHPLPVEEEPLVVSAGREHRDYETLAAACGDMHVQVFIAAASIHSPSARWTVPQRWPSNFTCHAADFVSLREWYARASVVVVPLMPTNFQAGVTTLLEAMAMGKAVVVSANRTHRELVEHGVTAVLVPPGDPAALRAAVRRLLDDAGERRKLGLAARAAVESRYDLNAYCDRLAGHIKEIAAAA